MKGRTTILFTLLTALCAVLFVVDLAVGSVDIPISKVIAALCGNGSEVMQTIVIDIRLARAIMAVLAGAALAVSGMQMQVLFRNPLAGPYVLGVSAGASLGVALFLLGAPLFGFALSRSQRSISLCLRISFLFINSLLNFCFHEPIISQ